MRNKPSSGGRKDNDRKPFKKEGGRTERPQGGKPPYKKADGRHRDDDRPQRRDADNGESRGKRNFEDNDRPKRSFDRQGDKPARPYGDKPKRNFDDNSERPKRSFDRQDDRPKRSFGNDSDRPRRNFDDNNDRPKRSFDKDDRPKRPFNSDADRPKRSFNNDGDRPKRSFDKKDDRSDRSYGDRPKRSFNDDSDRPQRPKRSFDGDNDRPKRSFDKDGDRPKRSFKEESERPKGRNEYDESADKKPRKDKEKLNPFDERLNKAFHADKKKEKLDDSSETLRTFEQADKDKLSIKDPEKGIGGEGFDQAFPLGARKVSGPFRKQFEKEKKEGFKGTGKRSDRKTSDDEPEEMTLNKYIAHSGQCSRREAAELVKKGKVKVNDELMLDPGYRVKAFDTVTIAGKKLTPQKNRAYILVNKPKDYITTNDDPEGRRTVMDLVDDAGVDRLFPVGRLDRNTTGLLLLTNDGDLAQKLSHPSYEVKKVYQVTLDKPLIKADFEKIVSGIELEDGTVHVDELAYLEQKNELGLEIHSGRNRIVRRIFESLGYQVEKLDRVMYAGLTKKNLPRGQWRFLSDKEVILLKHFKS